MFKKTVSAIVMAAMLAAALTGCGGKETATGTSEPAAQEKTTDSTKSESSTAEKEAFKVATVRWADWGEAYHEGFVDTAADKTGITINWETILNADWGDKKAVLLAGGDLPDAFLGSICFSAAEIASNQNTFLALDDYIDENMPNFKAVLEKDPIMKALATSSDGHIYSLPSKKPCRPIVANQMFINQKWLDNLGLSMPQTYEEFYEVLKKFKDEDANGNGDKGDEIPYGQGYADSTMFFLLPFGMNIGADNTYLMSVKNGEPVFLPTLDSYREGIKWMNKAFTEGLIDPEIYTQDTSMRDAKLMNETPLVGCAPGWTADATFGPNASEYTALPALKGPDGERYVSSDPEHWNYSRNEFMITNTCKDPAALLRYMDQFYTEDASIQTFYGSFGIGIEKDGDNYSLLPPTDGNSADTFAWINSLRDFGPKYVEDGFNDRVKLPTDSGDGLKLELDKELSKYAKPAYPNVSYTNEQLNNLSTLYMDISSYVTTMQAKWVTEGGVDSEWDTYLDTLKQMGYDDFIKIQKDAYKAYQDSTK
ncbi:extracellular solute-binding protein [Anaerocolumna sp. MB42-C2]|uniref:extracellular solute-binding protein n=1 Tax=Anaerocolumna sp. MB42-C2 TaxID=3070997 RepID=UPI0027DF0AB9|nr:extracellular solute-binding protein [Anaerocolumna sp. MB42-C2]WMJ89658.1 extracellular solute-binding protein [Anaerocolumna sp. MB42-C2]